MSDVRQLRTRFTFHPTCSNPDAVESIHTQTGSLVHGRFCMLLRLRVGASRACDVCRDSACRYHRMLMLTQTSPDSCNDRPIFNTCVDLGNFLTWQAPYSGARALRDRWRYGGCYRRPCSYFAARVDVDGRDQAVIPTRIGLEIALQ